MNLVQSLQKRRPIGTPTEIAEAYLVTEYVRRDSTRYSYQGLVNYPGIGVEKASVLLGVLRQLYDDPVVGELARAEYASLTVSSADGITGGLDLSEPLRNGNIRSIAGDYGALGNDFGLGIQAALLAVADIGGGWLAAWQIDGLTQAPTVEEITAGLIALQELDDSQWSTRISNMLVELRNRVNLFCQPAGQSLDNTPQVDIQALFPQADLDDLISRLQLLKTELE